MSKPDLSKMTKCLCCSGRAWNLGSCTGRAPETSEYMLTVPKPQSKSKTQMGFQMPPSVATSPIPVSLILQRPRKPSALPTDSFLGQLTPQSLHKWPFIWLSCPHATLKSTVTIASSTWHQYIQLWNTQHLKMFHVVRIFKKLNSVFQLAHTAIVSRDPSVRGVRL